MRFLPSRISARYREFQDGARKSIDNNITGDIESEAELIATITNKVTVQTQVHKIL